MSTNPKAPRFCIVCGCTEATPCPDRCFWMIKRDRDSGDRCSACIGITIAKPLTLAEFEALDWIHRADGGTHRLSGASMRRVLAAHLHAGRMTVRIESGEPVWRMTPSGREFAEAIKKADIHETKLKESRA